MLRSMDDRDDVCGQTSDRQPRWILVRQQQIRDCDYLGFSSGSFESMAVELIWWVLCKVDSKWLWMVCRWLIFCFILDTT